MAKLEQQFSYIFPTTFHFIFFTNLVKQLESNKKKSLSQIIGLSWAGHPGNSVRKMLMHIIHCVAFVPSQQVQATQWFELQLLYLSLFGPIRYGACAIDATPTRPLCNHNDPPLDNAHVSSLLIHVCRTSSFFFRQHGSSTTLMNSIKNETTSLGILLRANPQSKYPVLH